jgi:hypothetical protein
MPIPPLIIRESAEASASVNTRRDGGNAHSGGGRS